MKQKWITIAEYLNPSSNKPVKVIEKEVRYKTDAHKRLIIKQELNNGTLTREFLDNQGLPIIGKGFMEELDNAIKRIVTI